MEVTINTSLGPYRRSVCSFKDIIELVALLNRLRWEDNDFQENFGRRGEAGVPDSPQTKIIQPPKDELT